MRTALRLAGQHPAPHTSLLLLFRLDHARTARPALVRHPSLAGSAADAAGLVSRAPPLPHPARTLAPPGPPPWQHRPAPARSSRAARACLASVRRSEPGPSHGERPGVALRRSAPAVSSASAASRAGWSGPAEYYTPPPTPRVRATILLPRSRRTRAMAKTTAGLRWLLLLPLLGEGKSCWRPGPSWSGGVDAIENAALFAAGRRQRVCGPQGRGGERGGAAGRAPQAPSWAGLGLERDAGWARPPRSVFTVRAAAARRSLVALGPKPTDTVALSSQVARDG